MKTLIAGPWVGEFGWELFAWQAYVRSLSRNFDKTIIISRPNSKPLYGDFCDQFIEFSPTGGLSDSFFMHNVDCKKEIKNIITNNKIPLTKETTLFLPRRIGMPPHTHYKQAVIFGNYVVKPEYITFGLKGQRKYDYVFHIRDRKLREQDNWSLENWNKLKSLLSDKRIACIGTKRESGWIEGTEDLRDHSLEEVFDVLRNAECAFGPSSGPMHLASLCGCPHVVWSIPNNHKRYTTNWNPLQTPVLFDSHHSWHPSADYVFEKFSKWGLSV